MNGCHDLTATRGASLCQIHIQNVQVVVFCLRQVARVIWKHKLLNRRLAPEQGVAVALRERLWRLLTRQGDRDGGVRLSAMAVALPPRLRVSHTVYVPACI